MAHFAQLDENNVVLQVIVVNNAELLDESGQESEAKGIAFCQSLFGGTWVQTSYNGGFRKNYAGVGCIYLADIDAFVPPMPDDGQMYSWDEESQSWVPSSGSLTI